MENEKYYTGRGKNIFKTLALTLSKIVYLTLINSFSKQLIEEMKKYKKPSFGTT